MALPQSTSVCIFSPLSFFGSGVTIQIVAAIPGGAERTRRPSAFLYPGPEGGGGGGLNVLGIYVLSVLFMKIFLLHFNQPIFFYVMNL